MDPYHSWFSATSHDLDEAPMDLVFAQHYLQKLNLVSPQNRGRMSEYIAHQLDIAEEMVTASDRYPCAGKYLAQIAEARKRLGSANR